MPHYHLAWDATKQGYVVSLEITPDPQVSVNGYLRITRNNVQGPEVLLDASDLVPGWTHTLGPNESLHLTLTLSFDSATESSTKVIGRCTRPDGALHQGPPYQETYTGSDQSTTDVFVWVSR